MTQEYRKVYLKKDEEKRIQKGEVWVYDNELAGDIRGFSPGEVVKLYSSRDGYIATGFINPQSAITFRVLSRNIEDVIDRAFFRERIYRADEQRQAIHPENRCYRMVFSEADGLPGLVIDRFQDYVVVQVTAAGMEQVKTDIFDIIAELYPGCTLVEKSTGGARQKEGLPPLTREITPNRPMATVVDINGVKFNLDFLKSQKTGFFLDQRENYLLLRNICKGKEVMDIFSYAGAWGLHAYHYGAKRVEFLEASSPYLEQTRENILLNGFSLEDFSFLQADALVALKELSQGEPHKDVVILDPPAFIKSAAKAKQGMRGYHEVNLRALKMVKPGGFFVSCSCSHFFSRDDFLWVIHRAALDIKRSVKLLTFNTQPYDHPILLPLFPSEYLKCALFAVH